MQAPLLPLAITGAAVAVAALFPRALARRWLERRTAVHANRAPLWDVLYGLDWGEVTTNNYGFAPTRLSEPERYQLQMYQELLDRAVRASIAPRSRLLEVSCGRGGGLAHLVRRWPGEVAAVGLDLSPNAIAACRRRYGGSDVLTFEVGSALSLPFPNDTFDVVVNVEASNDYGDHAGFFAEVARVLRPGGLFLYCDSRRREDADRGEVLRAAGFDGELEDITDHVIMACRLDAERRANLIRRAPLHLRLLFGSRLRSYAALPGSRKFAAFESGRRRYVMACARRRPAAVGTARRLETELAV